MQALEITIEKVLYRIELPEFRIYKIDIEVEETVRNLDDKKLESHPELRFEDYPSFPFTPHQLAGLAQSHGEKLEIDPKIYRYGLPLRNVGTWYSEVPADVQRFLLSGAVTQENFLYMLCFFMWAPEPLRQANPALILLLAKRHIHDSNKIDRKTFYGGWVHPFTADLVRNLYFKAPRKLAALALQRDTDNPYVLIPPSRARINAFSKLEVAAVQIGQKIRTSSFRFYLSSDIYSDVIPKLCHFPGKLPLAALPEVAAFPSLLDHPLYRKLHAPGSREQLPHFYKLWRELRESSQLSEKSISSWPKFRTLEQMEQCVERFQAKMKLSLAHIHVDLLAINPTAKELRKQGYSNCITNKYSYHYQNYKSRLNEGLGFALRIDIEGTEYLADFAWYDSGKISIRDLASKHRGEFKHSRAAARWIVKNNLEPLYRKLCARKE